MTAIGGSKAPIYMFVIHCPWWSSVPIRNKSVVFRLKIHSDRSPNNCPHLLCRSRKSPAYYGLALRRCLARKPIGSRPALTLRRPEGPRAEPKVSRYKILLASATCVPPPSLGLPSLSILAAYIILATAGLPLIDPSRVM